MLVVQDAIDLMHRYEGLRLEAYLCPARVWTIGYGNTFYEDGTIVKKGDKITHQRAKQLFENITNNNFATPLRRLIKSKLNNYQFSALVCLVYNIGVGSFSRSTILKLVNTNPNNPNIRNQFMRWNRGGGQVLRGLTLRREAEANLYFKK
jgi:lysozyme